MIGDFLLEPLDDFHRFVGLGFQNPGDLNLSDRMIDPVHQLPKIPEKGSILYPCGPHQGSGLSLINPRIDQRQGFPIDDTARVSKPVP